MKEYCHFKESNVKKIPSTSDNLNSQYTIQQTFHSSSVVKIVLGHIEEGLEDLI